MRQTCRTEQVVAVGPEPVSDNTPQQRPGNEHAAIRRKDSPEVRIGLERRDESIARKRSDAHTYPGDPAMFAYALPDQPRTADLQHRSGSEQQNRTDRVGHAATVPDPRTRSKTSQHCTGRSPAATADTDETGTATHPLAIRH